MFTKNLHNLFLKVPEPQTNSCKKEKNKQTTNNKKTVCFYKSKGDVVTSRCHGSKTFRSQQTLVLQIWQEKKMICVNFGGMIALMIRNRTAAHRLFVSRSKMKMTVIVEIQKFCFHGNVAFLLSLREGSIRVGN